MPAAAVQRMAEMSADSRSAVCLPSSVAGFLVGPVLIARLISEILPTAANRGTLQCATVNDRNA